MMTVTRTMHVDAEPERVTFFFVDPSITAPGMTIEAVHETPDVVGSSYAWTFTMLGLRRKGVMVVTEYVPGTRVAFRNFGALEGASTWTVAPEDGGSKATGHVDVRLPIPVLGRLLEPILRRELDKNLEWGKRQLEQQQMAKAA